MDDIFDLLPYTFISNTHFTGFYSNYSLRWKSIELTGKPRSAFRFVHDCLNRLRDKNSRFGNDLVLIGKLVFIWNCGYDPVSL